MYKKEFEEISGPQKSEYLGAEHLSEVFATLFAKG